MSNTLEFQKEIKRLLRSGFYTLEDAQNTACEIIEFTGPDIQASILAQKAYSEIHFEQEQWNGPTDCDRLLQALEDLRAQGVVCCENFSCCGTCGSSEIWEFIEISQNLGKNVSGYVFYHQQDTDRAVEGEGLYFNYGAVDGPSENTAHQLMKALQKSGLSPSWNGSSSTRVFVPLNWKRKMMGT